MLEDILMMELMLLFDVHRLHELGDDVRHQPEAHQGAQPPGNVLRDEYLLKLLPDTFGADA
jgi:hypothetical protein